MHRFFSFLLTLFLSCLPLSLGALDAPETVAILTIDGDIGVMNDGKTAVYDRAMLERLDWREIDSYTDFTKGLQHFAGPTLSSLLKELGVSGGTLHAIALDDYVMEIPVSDAAEFNVILALEHNGKPMRVRQKGPIWIVYPAEVPEQVNELHSSRMVWQLKRITVSQ